MANTQARPRHHDTVVTEDDEVLFYLLQVAPGRPAPAHLYEEDHNMGDLTFARVTEDPDYQ